MKVLAILILLLKATDISSPMPDPLFPTSNTTVVSQDSQCLLPPAFAEPIPYDPMQETTHTNTTALYTSATPAPSINRSLQIKETILYYHGKIPYLIITSLLSITKLLLVLDKKNKQIAYLNEINKLQKEKINVLEIIKQEQKITIRGLEQEKKHQKEFMELENEHLKERLEIQEKHSEQLVSTSLDVIKKNNKESKSRILELEKHKKISTDCIMQYKEKVKTLEKENKEKQKKLNIFLEEPTQF